MSFLKATEVTVTVAAFVLVVHYKSYSLHDRRTDASVVVGGSSQPAALQERCLGTNTEDASDCLPAGGTTEVVP